MSATTKQERRDLLDRLAEAGGRLTAEDDVEFRGTKIVLPERMNLQDAAKFLREKIAEDENTVAYQRVYNYRPWDGARATNNALKKAFGMVAQRSTKHWWGEEPPHLITIPVSPFETESVPWGAIAVPHLPGLTLNLRGTMDQEYGQVFALTAEGPRKYRFHIEGIFRLVEQELLDDSLYRGKAFDGQTQPAFIDLSGFDESKVIYSEDVLTQLEANLWAVIRYADELQTLGMPLKRAILLEGPFGTGKTLAAAWTARVAEDHGWTFISCRPGRDDFMSVMQTARLYQPAVVFFEDVDGITDPTKAGGDTVSQLLDVFDGIQAKDTRIVVVLTTNHVERIHKGMVRPGRLDAVIHIGELDAVGYMRLLRAVIPDRALGTIDYDQIAKAFDGFLPAFAREAIDRALRYNIARNNGKVTLLHTDDFVLAAEGLRPQLELMRDASETGNAETIDTTISRIIAEHLDEAAVLDGDSDPVFTIRSAAIERR